MNNEDLGEIIKYADMHGKAPSYARIRKFRSSVFRK